MTLVCGPLVLPDAVRTGWLRVDRGRITAVQEGPPPPAPGEEVVEVTDGFVLPGLVDGHCHGALGRDFADRGDDVVAVAAGAHHRGGTTSLVASLLSAPPEPLRAAVRRLAPFVTDALIDGIHLEGPFLSRARRGAHPVDALRDPDLAEVDRLLTAGGGAVTYVTIAPELPGALDVVRELTGRGIRVGVGHTDADHGQTQRAIQAGARTATHLFNAMAPVHHRAGGPVVALTEDPRVTCELIADGHHLGPDVVRWVWSLLGTQRVMLVSDASAATLMPSGQYHLGEQTIAARSGAVWTQDGASLAGSSITLLDAVRWCTSIGISLLDAVTAASDTAARALGLADRGRLATGGRADLILTDADLRPQRVMRAGRWLTPG